MQNSFSCCAVHEHEDVKKAAGMTREAIMSRVATRERHEDGAGEKEDEAREERRKNKMTV